MKDNNTDEQKEENSKKPSRIMSFFRNLADRGLKRFQEFSESDFAKDSYDTYLKFMDNPTVKVLSSNMAGRIFAITCAAAAATGAIAGGWMIAGAGIAAVALGAVIDTILIDKTKTLYKEAKFLHRYRTSLEKQNAILEQNPQVHEALSPLLKKAKIESNKIDKAKEEILPASDSNAKNIRNQKSYASGLIISLINSAASIAGAILAPSPINVLKASGIVAFGAVSKGNTNATLSEKRDDFRQYINSENNKPDSPVYNNLLEIKNASREQKIQTLALEKLSKDPVITSRDNSLIIKKFELYKTQIESREEAILYKNNALYRMKQIGRNFIRAHDPFSEYSKPNEVGSKLLEKINRTQSETDRINTSQPDKSKEKESQGKDVGSNSFASNFESSKKEAKDFKNSIKNYPRSNIGR